MTKIYIPLEEGEQYACYVVYDKDTVRAYVQTPSYNSTSSYTDFYVNSHYLRKNGSTTWNNYSQLPSCLTSSIITHDFYYRNDLADIMIIFFILSIICVYLPLKIFSRLFGRWLKV